jgi:addiction module RelE/StbE family toxin
MFKGKGTRVIITKRAKEDFDELNKKIGEEIKKENYGTELQTLMNSIKQKIEMLKDNPQFGTHIQKDRIPREYVNDYEVNNLWKVNLAGAWRMIYTIRGDKIEIVSLILDIINHKDYDKKFGYKSR